MFYVGQKVVCVDVRNPRNPTHAPMILSEGAIYTVRAFSPHDGGLLLQEVKNKPRPSIEYGEFERGYKRWRFRPLVERKTDISIFTRMLMSNQREVENV